MDIDLDLRIFIFKRFVKVHLQVFKVTSANSITINYFYFIWAGNVTEK